MKIKKRVSNSKVEKNNIKKDGNAEMKKDNVNVNGVVSNSNVNEEGQVVKMSNKIKVNQKVMKRVMCCEVERDDKKYILNLMADKVGQKIRIEVIVSKETEVKACSWNRVLTSNDGLMLTNDNIEGCANFVVNTYADEIIDYFEEQTETMYSFERVKEWMQFLAQKQEDYGHNQVEMYMAMHTNHIPNEQEYDEISEFVRLLKNESDPIGFYMNYIEEIESEVA